MEKLNVLLVVIDVILFFSMGIILHRQYPYNLATWVNGIAGSLLAALAFSGILEFQNASLIGGGLILAGAHIVLFRELLNSQKQK